MLESIIGPKKKGDATPINSGRPRLAKYNKYNSVLEAEHPFKVREQSKVNESQLGKRRFETEYQSIPQKRRIAGINENNKENVEERVPDIQHKTSLEDSKILTEANSEIGRPYLPRRAKLLTTNMSTYDQFNYQHSEHRVGRNLHSSDSYYSPDALHDISASMASLCNIGNSCYMNSVIYTLRFAPFFLHNLHHLVEDMSQINSRKENQVKAKSSSLGRNVGSLQGQNARSWSSKDLASLGSSGSPIDILKTIQQIATERLHDLFQNLHKNEATDSLEPYQSDNFLKAIQEVNPIFEGNQQQDAHEFLMCILDSIRETCQALTKVIKDHPEIIMNGFVSLSEQNEIPPLPVTSAPLNQTAEKKSTIWFLRSKNNRDKSKTSKAESPSKDVEHPENCLIGTNSIDSMDSKSINTDKTLVLEKIKSLGLDFFSEDFEGVTVSSTRCLSCEGVTEQKETMIDLSVPITENMEMLEHSNSFIQNLCITREQFRGDNKYRCEECMGYTEAIRTISYPVLPRLLIIQLKRFSGGMEKINSYIPTPFTLQCFCSACCALPADSEKPHEYHLYSVITHVGPTMCAGHYIAYTCPLNLNTTYINCPKDLKRKEFHAAALSVTNSQKASSNANGNGSNSNSVTGAIEKNVTHIKKMIAFRRTKTTSSTDVTKNVKLNGIKTIANGMDKLNLGLNATNGVNSNTNCCCPGGECCSISMNLCKPQTQLANGTSGSNSVGGSNSNATVTNGMEPREHSRNNSLSSGYSEQYYSPTSGASSIGSAGSRKVEPLWYMCDDDKIKAMPQHEFQEMLLPNKKNTITPYLLFYVRSDIHPNP